MLRSAPGGATTLRRVSRRAGPEDDTTHVFTIDHFRGYAAVLVQPSRMGEITRAELVGVATDAWAHRAPKCLVREHLDG